MNLGQVFATKLATPKFGFSELWPSGITIRDSGLCRLHLWGSSAHINPRWINLGGRAGEAPWSGVFAAAPEGGNPTPWALPGHKEQAAGCAHRLSGGGGFLRESTVPPWSTKWGGSRG